MLELAPNVILVIARLQLLSTSGILVESHNIDDRLRVSMLVLLCNARGRQQLLPFFWQALEIDVRDNFDEFMSKMKTDCKLAGVVIKADMGEVHGIIRT